MSVSYRAACLTAPRTVSLKSRALTEPGPHEVLVRLEGCGVCGSNLPVWEGREWFTYPLEPGAPGHEGWGVIETTGMDVRAFKAGDRVAMLSQHAFAEVDMAAEDQIVKLPPELDGQPFPGEALGCAMNVFRRADIQPGQRVAVVGIGFMGALLVRLAANAGAVVYAISRRVFALETARLMGAQETIPLDDHWRIIDAVKALTGGAGCERVIEATGLQWPLDLAGELTAERGKLIIAGYHQDGMRQVNMQLWNWRGLDVINAHERDPKIYLRGMQEAVNAVASGQLDPSPLYTHRFPLDRAADALDIMRERDGDFLKALVLT